MVPLVHGVRVGSTGCVGEGVDIVCTQPNSPEIALVGFDPAEDAVIVDWAALFADVSLTTPTTDCHESDEHTICTCDSVGPAALCRPMFASLGLEWTSGADTGEQLVFRVQSMARSPG